MSTLSARCYLFYRKRTVSIISGWTASVIMEMERECPDEYESNLQILLGDAYKSGNVVGFVA